MREEVMSTSGNFVSGRIENPKFESERKKEEKK
jgi:hypothetical protein